MSHIRGRFQKAADKAATAYSASVSFDWRLYPHDIAGSVAHTRMLAKQGIITQREAKIITDGLAEIGREIESGKFKPDTLISQRLRR